MTRRAAIKQADAKRLIAAALSAGAVIRRINLENGRLTLDLGEEPPETKALNPSNRLQQLDGRPVIDL
jgi:hypothetical protein